jgi:hypothetical protein
MLWRLITLAEKNPQAALMDGAEYLMHQRMIMGTKSQPEIPFNENNVVESSPVQLSNEERLLLNQPEQIPQDDSTIEQDKNKGAE